MEVTKGLGVTLEAARDLVGTQAMATKAMGTKGALVGVIKAMGEIIQEIKEEVSEFLLSQRMGTATNRTLTKVYRI